LKMKSDGWKNNMSAGKRGRSSRDRKRKRRGKRTKRRKRGRRGVVNTNGLQPVQCCINRV